jgi:hypothetical protein
VTGKARSQRRRPKFEAPVPRGPLLCGSPEEIVAKLVSLHELYRHDMHMFHTCTASPKKWCQG